MWTLVVGQFDYRVHKAVTKATAGADLSIAAGIVFHGQLERVLGKLEVVVDANLFDEYRQEITNGKWESRHRQSDGGREKQKKISLPPSSRRDECRPRKSAGGHRSDIFKRRGHKTIKKRPIA